MKIEKVKKLSMFDRFTYMITERESIRIRKEEIGSPKPWTDDEILRSYRFCNVRRMDDKVSKWLLKNWYEPHADSPNMLIACTIARQLNNPQSLAAIGFPDPWDPRRAERILNKRALDGMKNFSAAYMITGTLGGTKIQQIVWKVVDALHQTRMLGSWITTGTRSMELCCKSLFPCAGFSTFIAGQVVADMRWAFNRPGFWQDRNSWAPIGPGSRRGMNRLLGRDKDTAMPQKEFLKHFLPLMEKTKAAIPVPIANKLEAMDYQNCLCEFDKYNRVLFGEGRPKQKYPGAA